MPKTKKTKKAPATPPRLTYLEQKLGQLFSPTKSKPAKRTK